MKTLKTFKTEQMQDKEFAREYEKIQQELDEIREQAERKTETEAERRNY